MNKSKDFAARREENRGEAVKRMTNWLAQNKPDETLDLSGLGLTTLPEHLPASLRSLDLRNNQLILLPRENPADIQELFVDQRHPKPTWVGQMKKVFVEPKTKLLEPAQGLQSRTSSDSEDEQSVYSGTDTSSNSALEHLQASMASNPERRDRFSSVHRPIDDSKPPSTSSLNQHIEETPLIDVETRRAKPPDGENASNFNDKDDSVPNFPQLRRGSALLDGDCLFNSVIHLARPLLARQIGVTPESLTATVLRRDVAANMIFEFQTLNVKEATAPKSQNLSRNPAQIADVSDTYKLLSEMAEDNDRALPDDAELAALLGSYRHVEEFKTLKPNQQVHVMRMARTGDYGGIAGDFMPRLLVDSFTGLQLITHKPGSNAESLANNGTFLRYSEPHSNENPVQTVRVFLDDEHYEPVYEVGAPTPSEHEGI